MPDDEDISEMSQETFLEWAMTSLTELKELTIFSHTPIMLYPEEKTQIMKKYRNGLEQRFVENRFPTIYITSKRSIEQQLNKTTTSDPTNERIQMLYNLLGIAEKSNRTRIWVIQDGLFPKISYWYGVEKNGFSHCYIKIYFENATYDRWFRLGDAPPKWIQKIITKIPTHSIEFCEYIRKELKWETEIKPDDI
jgi:hypothetical protein